MNHAQQSLLEEIIVDNFAGGGGASTGIELATGRIVDIAINHDPDAIIMHKTNHPYTAHYCESVWDIDPVKACAGRPVGLAWFSPDCKHFSKAKGSAPVSKNIRGLAWIVLRWAAKVRPRVIILENVEEFQTWGPVRNGKPVKSKKGETFKQWKEQLVRLGYTVEHRELVAADYGAPTIRKRFFLIARCDGRPIVWPEPTHSKTGTDGKKKWRSAADIIDWSLPCPSIFDTAAEIKKKYDLRAQRPLAGNTQRRVARGIDKFVLRNQNPFIIPVGYGERDGQAPRIHPLDEPVPTTVGSGKHYMCKPSWSLANTGGSVGAETDEPIGTTRTAGGHLLVAPSMVQVNHAGDFRGQEADSPLQTVTGKNGHGIIAPVITAIGQTGFKSDRCSDVEAPINTTVSKAETCLIAPTVIQYHTEKQGETVRGQSTEEPLMTVDSSGRYAIAAANITEYFGNADAGYPMDEPTHTATGKDRAGVSVAFMSQYFDGGYQGAGNPMENPLNTVTAVDHNSLVASHMVKMKGLEIGGNANEPLHTVTAGGLHHGEIRTHLARYEDNIDVGRWALVRDLLNKHCGYSLADDEIILISFGGYSWFISDIGLRMLTPQELYAANGFPCDYIIDRDYLGNEYSKTKQVARCGNAVPPPFATALVRANLPEWCEKEINTMAELKQMVAV